MAFEEDVPLFLGVGCTASWRCRDLRRGDEHGAPLPCTCIAATLQTSKFIPRNTNVHTLNDLNTIHTKAIYATIFAASGIFPNPETQNNKVAEYICRCGRRKNKCSRDTLMRSE
jgi:hypothetical protein